MESLPQLTSSNVLEVSSSSEPPNLDSRSWLSWLPLPVRIMGAVIASFLLFFSVCYYVLISPPSDFAPGSIVQIKEGVSIGKATEYLYDRSLIRSRTVFKLLMRSPLAKNQMVAGDYLFAEPLSSIEISRRLARGSFNLEPIKVTIPEGTDTRAISNILANVIPDFDQAYFLTLASTSEGYLFPDTYFFSPLVTEQQILTTLRKNFDTRTKDITFTLVGTKYDRKDIVTMASIVELEAANYEDRRIIADILWRRLEEGMALQVDAVFPYIIGKNTFELTTKDLQFDSPYNTYRYPGLPPGPVTNPGLESIKAVLDPLPNKYVYYLSDRDGVMHYTASYAEHLKNKIKYLK